MVGASEFPQIVGPAYTYPTWPIDCQESINFEPLPIESKDSPYKSMLVGTPGIDHIQFRLSDSSVVDDLPAGGDYPIRGIHRCSRGFGGDPNPATVVVAGKYVYEMKEPVDGISDVTALMELPSSSSEWHTRVSIADGGGEPNSGYPPKVVIADGHMFHVINMDDGYTDSIPSSSAPCAPDFLAFLDARVYACGKTVNTDLREQRVYWSEINDPGTWGAADFVSATVSNDPLKCIKSVSNYLWMIGSDTYEIWQTASSSGTLYSPIKKVMGSPNGVGTASGNSVATISDRIYFVGGGPTGHARIYEGEGTRLHYISTDAMEMELSKYNLENSVGFCYSDEGRSYYVVTFLSDDVTWVYCRESKAWHKRSTRSDDNVFHKWEVGFTSYNWGMLLAGSIEGNRVYRLSSDIYTDDGKTIVRKRVSPHIVTGANFTRHSSFTIDIETGTGLEYGQGSEPQVMLQALDDGGRLARGERWISTGRNGNYRKRVKWYKLGQARDRAYQIYVSDPVRWRIYGARIEFEKQKGGL